MSNLNLPFVLKAKLAIVTLTSSIIMYWFVSHIKAPTPPCFPLLPGSDFSEFKSLAFPRWKLFLLSSGVCFLSQTLRTVSCKVVIVLYKRIGFQIISVCVVHHLKIFLLSLSGLQESHVLPYKSHFHYLVRCTWEQDGLPVSLHLIHVPPELWVLKQGVNKKLTLL